MWFDVQMRQLAMECQVIHKSMCKSTILGFGYGTLALYQHKRAAWTQSNHCLY